MFIIEVHAFAHTHTHTEWDIFSPVSIMMMTIKIYPKKRARERERSYLEKKPARKKKHHKPFNIGKTKNKTKKFLFFLENFKQKKNSFHFIIDHWLKKSMQGYYKKKHHHPSHIFQVYSCVCVANLFFLDILRKKTFFSISSSSYPSNQFKDKICCCCCCCPSSSSSSWMISGGGGSGGHLTGINLKCFHFFFVFSFFLLLKQKDNHYHLTLSRIPWMWMWMFKFSLPFSHFYFLLFKSK